MNPDVFLVSAPLAVALVVGAGGSPGGTGGAAANAVAANPATAPMPALIARVDDLYKRRDEKTAWHEQQRLVQAMLARGSNDFNVLWRAARFYFWASDDPGVSREQRSRWG